jgi:hypothetical protein
VVKNQRKSVQPQWKFVRVDLQQYQNVDELKQKYEYRHRSSTHLLLVKHENQNTHCDEV